MTAATKYLSVALLVLASMTAASCLPLSKNKGIFITPDNIRNFASFIDSTVTIGEETISIARGTANEDLIRVPLAGFGELDPNTAIRITVGQRPVSGRDYDPQIGISDGEADNLFFIHDNSGAPECRPVGGTHVNNVIGGTTISSQYVLLFEPFHRYGSCSSAQNGGYVNVGRFNSQVDLSKGVELVVRRDQNPETYDFYYFIVELI